MKQIVIIGAGPAGLTAAAELLIKDPSCHITILESSGVIGGISQTVRYHGNRMDIGGHRFFSKSDEVNRFWLSRLPLQGQPSYDDKLLGREASLSPGGPDPEQEDRVMLYRERVSRIYYRKKFFDYPISMKWQTLRNMGFVCTMKAGFSYLASTLHKLPETSLENFYINRFGRVLYQMFFEGYTEKLWGRHPSEIAADWGAQRVKGLSIRALLKDSFSKLFGRTSNQVETSLIEQFWYPKYGPGQLWELVADEITDKGGEIRFHAEVVRVEETDGKITGVVAKTPEGEIVFPADVVLSSMPVKDLVTAMDAPQEITALAAGLPYRDFVTVGLLLKDLKLKNETARKTLRGIVPDCWIYVQEPDVKVGRIQIFNNWSPYLVKEVDSTVWIGLEYFCTEGDDFWEMPEGDCIEFAVRELIQMGMIDSPDDLLDAHRERVKKAYPAYFDSYAEIDRVTAYLDRYDNLFCIGRNGQHRYNNMDHSMLTAIRAAEQIVSGNIDKQEIWNVNTEQAYHETK